MLIFQFYSVTFPSHLVVAIFWVTSIYNTFEVTRLNLVNVTKPPFKFRVCSASSQIALIKVMNSSC